MQPADNLFKKAQAILQREFLVERQSLSGTVDGAQRVTTLKKKISSSGNFFQFHGNIPSKRSLSKALA
jgi:hypothetical protein